MIEPWRVQNNLGKIIVLAIQECSFLLFLWHASDTSRDLKHFFQCMVLPTKIYKAIDRTLFRLKRNCGCTIVKTLYFILSYTNTHLLHRVFDRGDLDCPISPIGGGGEGSG